MKRKKTETQANVVSGVVSETNHTPTPWILGKDKSTDDYIRIDIYGKGGEAEGDLVPNTFANREFIVRAVNSHKALLEAAKDAYAVMKHARHVDPLVERLEKAIAQAEGSVNNTDGKGR